MTCRDRARDGSIEVGTVSVVNDGWEAGSGLIIVTRCVARSSTHKVSPNRPAATGARNSPGPSPLRPNRLSGRPLPSNQRTAPSAGSEPTATRPLGNPTTQSTVDRSWADPAILRVSTPRLVSRPSWASERPGAAIAPRSSNAEQTPFSQVTRHYAQKRGRWLGGLRTHRPE
jgi:hypothetical protein